MLNKIKIIGKVLPIEIKENDNEERERNELIFYFSLSVTNPSGSLTILRCVVQGEKAEEIKREVKKDEVLEIKGYLRNEKVGRQILLKVINFTKLDITPDEIENTQSNQVRLLGKIVTDFRGEFDVLSFRLAVPREGNISPLFFCRVQGELISEMNSKLKKGDIILLEGFLQTKKITEGRIGEEAEKNLPRISSIICQAFTFIDNDSANDFTPLGELTRVERKVEKIDFTKPKENRSSEKITE